jgi:hypothetical protein
VGFLIFSTHPHARSARTQRNAPDAMRTHRTARTPRRTHARTRTRMRDRARYRALGFNIIVSSRARITHAADH